MSENILLGVILASIGDADALKQQATQIATRDNPLSALYPIGSMADVCPVI